MAWCAGDAPPAELVALRDPGPLLQERAPDDNAGGVGAGPV